MIEQLIRFHEELNDAIRLWCRMIDALQTADTRACYALSFQLMELQPDAISIDFARVTCAVCGASAPEHNRCPGCRAFFCNAHYEIHLQDNARFLKSIGTEGTACDG